MTITIKATAGFECCACHKIIADDDCPQCSSVIDFDKLPNGAFPLEVLTDHKYHGLKDKKLIKDIKKAKWVAPGYGSRWDSMSEYYGVPNLKTGNYCYDCLDKALDKARKDKTLIIWHFNSWHNGKYDVTMIDRAPGDVMHSHVPEYYHLWRKRMDKDNKQDQKKIEKGMKLITPEVKEAAIAYRETVKAFFKKRHQCKNYDFAVSESIFAALNALRKGDC